MNNKILNDARIIELYEAGKSITCIAKEEKVARKTVKSRLIKYGFRIEQRYYKKYSNSTKLFISEKISTEEEAYILGLYMADGTISMRDKMVGLDLSKKDRSHMKKIKRIWNIRNPIGETTNNHSGSVYLRFYDHRIFNKMMDFGVIPNKSYYGQFPNEEWFVDNDLLRHYIRGYFDGDGCIAYSHITRPILTFVGTLAMITGIRHYIANTFGIHMTLNKKADNSWGTVLVGGFNQVSFLINWMQYDTDLLLKRKRERYKRLLKDRQKGGLTIEPDYSRIRNVGAIPSIFSFRNRMD